MFTSLSSEQKGPRGGAEDGIVEQKKQQRGGLVRTLAAWKFRSLQPASCPAGLPTNGGESVEGRHISCHGEGSARAARVYSGMLAQALVFPAEK